MATPAVHRAELVAPPAARVCPADPTSTMPAPAILAAVPAESVTSVAGEQDTNAQLAWDDEGGSQAGYRPHRTVTGVVPAIRVAGPALTHGWATP